MSTPRYCVDCGAECCDRCGECLGLGCICTRHGLVDDDYYQDLMDRREEFRDEPLEEDDDDA